VREAADQEPEQHAHDDGQPKPTIVTQKVLQAWASMRP
jgi:hypothetical protein